MWKDKNQPVYFDFDKDSRLECFVRHRRSMVSKKVDYEVRKKCSEMEEHTCIKKFRFRNQSAIRFRPNAAVRRFDYGHSNREHQKEIY